MADSSNAIIVHKSKVLLLLRDDFPELRDANKWSLVGGEVDPGENFDETLIREVEEEVGIWLRERRYLGKVKTEDGVHAIYFVQLDDEEAARLELGDEGQKIDFFTVKEMEELDLTENLSWYFEKTKDYMKDIIENGEVIDPKKLGLIKT